MIGLTLALGSAVAISWFAFGDRPTLGPLRAMHLSWPWIYGSQALMAAGIGALIGRNVSGAGRWIAFVIAAWLAELVALTLGGTLLANELVPGAAWFYWWVGTGGPVQPAAAVAGGLAARSWRRRSAKIEHAPPR